MDDTLSLKNVQSFEILMCKKVAELTQVVYLLFTENHEKEVELEAVTDVYEYELRLKEEEARARIVDKERATEELKRKFASKLEDCKKAHERELHARGEEWKKRLRSVEHLLKDEKEECGYLRDMLIHAHRDMGELRGGIDERNAIEAEERRLREEEMARQRQKISGLERAIKESQRRSGDTVRFLQKRAEKSEQKQLRMQKEAEKFKRLYEQWINRNKQLKHDIEGLQKSFIKQLADATGSQSSSKAFSDPWKTNDSEIQRLRRQVEQYKMELKNREKNFNHMFTDKQPLSVDRSAGKLAVGRGSRAPSRTSLYNIRRSDTKSSEPSTASFSNCQGILLRNLSGDRRAPAVPDDPRMRLSGLARPRPLPEKCFLGSS